MNRNKYSISRLKRLSAMLKENRYPNFPRFLAEMKKTDLAGAYKLSARTFLRDIAFLKSEYGAPIRYDYTQKGYYLTVPDWSIDIPYLEDNEMQAAVLGARLAENIMPEPVKRTVRDAVDSLLSVNEKGMDEKATLLSLIAMGSRVSIRPEVFQPLFESWQTHRCVRIVYDSVTGCQSTHLIEPQVLAFYEGNWYIKGFSLIRDGRKIPAKERRANVFALHRILSVEKTEKTFVPDRKTVEAANRRELFVFPMVKDIRLRLGPEARKFIVEQFDVTEESRDGDYSIVRIAAAPAYRIVNYVLVAGGDAQLLNHPELAEKVIKRAEQTIKVHRETKK